MENENRVLDVENLQVSFHTYAGEVKAVRGVSFHVDKGETLAFVGESGSGKTTVGRAVIRANPCAKGAIYYKGVRISGKIPKALDRQVIRNIQMVFQDPYASLDPRMTVRDIIAEPLETWKVTKTREETTKRVLELMAEVGVSGEFLYRYPHQFSGGQRQRIGIARAIALDPKLVICDEPVSALDVSVQSQVLNLLKDLQEEKKLTYLFISHDLSVVRFMSDRVCVMFLGKVCEIGSTRDIYENPLHPYTRFLLEAIPKADPTAKLEDKNILQGDIPSPMDPPKGCRFHTRCPYATEKCRTEEPELRCIDGRQVACHEVKE